MTKREYQVKDLDGSWIGCDKDRYDAELGAYRRVVNVSNFYCKEWDSVGFQCEEQCDKCRKAYSMPEDLGDVYINEPLMNERIETNKQIKEGDIITCSACDHEFPLTNPIIVCPKCGKETWF